MRDSYGVVKPDPGGGEDYLAVKAWGQPAEACACPLIP